MALTVSINECFSQKNINGRKKYNVTNFKSFLNFHGTLDLEAGRSAIKTHI